MKKIDYRKIWTKTYGPIPKDEHGRTYEIHHIDGNRLNNDPKNLICVSIQEHYDLHYARGDYGACVMIAKRMNLPPDHLSKIQRGSKRPGVGGVKKGTRPWNKNKSGYKVNTTEEGKKRKIAAAKKNNKIDDIAAGKIRSDYHSGVDIKNCEIGKVTRNGKKLTYERAFSLEYSKIYNVTPQYIVNIIKGIVKVV